MSRRGRGRPRKVRGGRGRPRSWPQQRRGRKRQQSPVSETVSALDERKKDILNKANVQFVPDPCAMYILRCISKGEREMGRLQTEASKEFKKIWNKIRYQLKKLGNVFPTHREVSAQEAVYRFLSMPMKKCSRQVVFINTSLPSERIHILKCRHQLQQLDPDNDDVYQKGLLNRYADRPKSLENMFLADFGSFFYINLMKEIQKK